VVKQISPEEAYLVRHPILRPGRPFETCILEGDTLDSTFHFGFFDNQELQGTVSFMKKDHLELNLTNAYQLRGMAVMTQNQGKGIGKKIVQAGEHLLSQMKISSVWLNAREIAVPFYEKLGYQHIGTPFDIPLIGQHFIMHKTLKTNHE
jgi:predicted N-acetyltransferase YhbS